MHGVLALFCGACAAIAAALGARAIVLRRWRAASGWAALSVFAVVADVVGFAVGVALAVSRVADPVTGETPPAEKATVLAEAISEHINGFVLGSSGMIVVAAILWLMVARSRRGPPG